MALPTFLRNLAKKRTLWRRVAPITAGAGAAGGVAALLSRARKRRIVRKGPIEYDKTRGVIRWYTYKGGPILEGPAYVMLQLFRVGRMNRQQGLAYLSQLLRAGTIRKVGVV